MTDLRDALAPLPDALKDAIVEAWASLTAWREWRERNGIRSQSAHERFLLDSLAALDAAVAQLSTINPIESSLEDAARLKAEVEKHADASSNAYGMVYELEAMCEWLADKCAEMNADTRFTDDRADHAGYWLEAALAAMKEER